MFFFFFQAEDGIRDDLVTGVQTCALPICARARGTFDGRVIDVHELASTEAGLTARGRVELTERGPSVQGQARLDTRDLGALPTLRGRVSGAGVAEVTGSYRDGRGEGT